MIYGINAEYLTICVTSKLMLIESVYIMVEILQGLRTLLRRTIDVSRVLPKFCKPRFWALDACINQKILAEPPCKNEIEVRRG